MSESNAPPPGATAPLPPWFLALSDHYRAKAAHQFLLHFNIQDHVLVEGRITTVRDLLVQRLADRFLIVTYSLSRGIGFPATGQAQAESLGREPGLGRLLGFRESAEGNMPVDPTRDDRDFHRLQGQGRTSPLQPPDEALPAIERALRQGGRRLCVLLEHVDKLAPADARGRDQWIAVETLQRWALDGELAEHGHLVVMLAAEHGQVAAAVQGANSGTVSLQIPLPDAAARRTYLDHVLADPHFARLAWQPDFTPADLAGHTVGFSLRDILNTLRLAAATGRAIGQDLVAERKRDIIRLESHGLLQIVETRHGLDDIGGLEHVKAYLGEKIGNIRSYLDLNARHEHTDASRDALARALALVPRGILLAGPPGTGKTILAEALAHGTQLNMVKLQDIRSMWVGESERNLTKVLDLLVALAPVLVFVDEIDQALGSRGGPTAGAGGDTDKRIFGKLLEFMGDNRHRGRVLWVAATNRPDFLDAAMLRRFDRVVPILAPDREERTAVLATLAGRIGTRYGTDVELGAIAERTEGLTGAGLEVIVRRAAELATDNVITQHGLVTALEDHKPNHDPAVYVEQAMRALVAANFFSMLPRHLPPDLAELVEACRQERSNAPLERALARLMP